MEFTYHFIGWCNDGNHDKVWTAFEVNGNFYCGWGRRGKKLAFKKHPSFRSLLSIQKTKESRYKPVDQFLLFSIFPDFEDQVEQDLFMSTMAGKVM